ncbi:MAG TPA: nitroreductase family protein [Nitrospiria bacterium]|nr:nitroreductase family protein [Nitrospiria bacterium]
MPHVPKSVDVMEAINQRHSVRDYLPRRLDRDTIRALLAAAVRAPTAMHGEPWAFAILQDSDALKRLSDRAKTLFAEEARRLHLDQSGRALDIFSAPEFNIFYNATTLIVICGKPIGPFVAADCWLAAENLMLAAHAMGLGTCVIGSALLALNEPAGKAVAGIPTDHTAFAALIAGVPRGDTSPTPRKAPNIVAWR